MLAPTVQFSSRFHLLKRMVEMVFGGAANERLFRACATGEQSNLRPAWFPYVKKRESSIWGKFSEQTRRDTVEVLGRYFETLFDATQDLNQIFFKAYEQQGANFLTSLLPEYRRQLGTDSWSAVIAALGSLFERDEPVGRYNRKESGGLRRPFYRRIRQQPSGKALIDTLKRYPPGRRSGWQLLWQMMRGCAALEKWDYDFERALSDISVIQYLEGVAKFDADAALNNWKARSERFSEFVNGLPGIGWNTFDYLLRDLPFPGCLLLFKLDSMNERFVQKVFGLALAGNRTKYLETLTQTGILDDYPPAVINIAIYAFSSPYCLGYLKSLSIEAGGRFTLAPSQKSKLASKN